MDVFSVRSGSTINLLNSYGPWKIIDLLFSGVVVFGSWNVFVCLVICLEIVCHLLKRCRITVGSISW